MLFNNVMVRYVMFGNKGDTCPTGRWHLFMHEVNAELDRGESMVVVLAADGLTPIDAVSDTNFYDFEVNDFDATELSQATPSTAARDAHTCTLGASDGKAVQATTPNNSATDSVTLNISWPVKE